MIFRGTQYKISGVGEKSYDFPLKIICLGSSHLMPKEKLPMLPCGAFASEQIVLLFSSHLVCLDSRPAPAPAGFFQCRWVFPRATAPPAPSRGRPSPAPDADLPSLFTIHSRHRGHRGHGLGSASPAPETQEATRREASRLPLQGAPSPPPLDGETEATPAERCLADGPASRAGFDQEAKSVPASPASTAPGGP